MVGVQQTHVVVGERRWVVIQLLLEQLFHVGLHHSPPPCSIPGSGDLEASMIDSGICTALGLDGIACPSAIVMLDQPVPLPVSK